MSLSAERNLQPSRPARSARPRAFAGGGDGALEIGLVVNMPDSALAATERQFTRLIEAAAAGRDLRLHLYTFAGVDRSAEAHAFMAGRYRPASDLGGQRLDALVVTGTEPRAPRLDQEPYWPELAGLVDWAAANTVSTLWSCLAAHAAVLHLDGIERRPLPAKCSGVFASAQAGEHPLLAGLGGGLTIAHSRWNTLDAGDLERHGYRVLTAAEGAGVDVFVKDAGSRFVFFHGHPEYEDLSLLKEYRRDVGRYLAGERDLYPDLPAHYFDERTESALGRFRELAELDRGLVALADMPPMRLDDGLADRMAATAAGLFGNWIGAIAGATSRRPAVAGGGRR